MYIITLLILIYEEKMNACFYVLESSTAMQFKYVINGVSTKFSEECTEIISSIKQYIEHYNGK